MIIIMNCGVNDEQLLSDHPFNQEEQEPPICQCAICLGNAYEIAHDLIDCENCGEIDIFDVSYWIVAHHWRR